MWESRNQVASVAKSPGLAHQRWVCCWPQVLHKFLEVFSGFDWDRYCLSLRGPIALDSFPNPVGARLWGP